MFPCCRSEEPCCSAAVFDSNLRPTSSASDNVDIVFDSNACALGFFPYLYEFISTFFMEMCDMKPLIYVLQCISVIFSWIIYKVFCTGAVKACCPLQVSLVLSALQAGNKGTQACITAASAVSGIIADLDTTIMFASAGTLNPENEDSFADHRCSRRGNRLTGVMERNTHVDAEVKPLIFSGKLKDTGHFNIRILISETFCD